MAAGAVTVRRGLSSTSGSKLSPALRVLLVNSAADFSFASFKFGTWFGHVTADSLPTLKVMRSKVKLVTQKEIHHELRVIL